MKKKKNKNNFLNQNLDVMIRNEARDCTLQSLAWCTCLIYDTECILGKRDVFESYFEMLWKSVFLMFFLLHVFKITRRIKYEEQEGLTESRK